MSAARSDLLLVGSDDEGLGTLCHGLESVGYHVDRVDDLGSIRMAFFTAGGHDAVILGPGLSVSGVDLVLRDLQELDPELRCIVFAGYERAPATTTTRIRGLHPASTSALGAVHRALLD
ncbi:MAG: hypothetical protein AAF196_07110 [Planctomycetota bacterium]